MVGRDGFEPPTFRRTWFTVRRLRPTRPPTHNISLKWRPRSDLNRRSPAWQAGMLTTTPRGRRRGAMFDVRSSIERTIFRELDIYSATIRRVDYQITSLLGYLQSTKFAILAKIFGWGVEPRASNLELRNWWAMTGSNRRHPACKAGALPAELIALDWWPIRDSNPCYRRERAVS